MHAAVVTAFGPADVLELTELPDPAPGPGQVAIDVTHAAVGLIDVYVRQGLYKDQKGLPQPPYVPGLEVAGTVRALGDGVEGLRVGEPVVTLSGTGAEGGYASVAVVDAAMTVSLEGSGVDPASAVAAVPNAATAYLALTEVAHLKPGEHVLVHGALGGLASAFPGMARTLGAAGVTGTARRPALERARTSALPYDDVLASDDFAEAVGDRRFDIVVDPVGGQVRTDSLRVMAPMGRMLLVGNAGGDWQHTVPTNTLWGGNLAMLGFAVGHHLPNHPEQARPAARAALEAIRQGLIPIDIQTLPLSQAAEAHRRIENGSVGGKLVLAP
ncbi:zinc-binding alcohol dehydrogenase family protein [Streptomyces antibioticus]|uniref:NADPH quinone reductase n=1 Tax=Streptomyces antibioticus TaxID=1890 RepID=A0AAE7CP64_STRAT|nr:zinc-binding dehydrogenase [Streptomyces antibioticus]OOQ48135.1 NADPH quinone reductase [Streptomyces antibioticus]QIT48500.1 zinc-binding dehydrogenase [Streptomyces antibioticus]